MSDKGNLSKKFILHGGILAMAGIIVRIIGMIYRIPLMNIIGSEGNGIYSVAFNIYNIALIISCYGLPMAVSKLVSARLVKRQYANACGIFRMAFVTALCTGGVAALLLFFGADYLEKVVYSGSYPGLALPIKVLAPTVLIVAVLGVVRGFFQGHGTMIPTAVSQLLEQIVNAFASVIAAYFLMKGVQSAIDGISSASAYGAAGGTLGTALGALSAFLYVMFIYFIYRPSFMRKVARNGSRYHEGRGDLLKILVITVIPIMLGQTFYQISAALDDVMYGRIMKDAGVAATVISKTSGNYNSSYMILINLPMGIASAMSSSMLPSVVASYAQKNIREIRRKIAATVKINMMIAIPSFVGLFCVGGAIIRLLFPSYDYVEGAMMLKIGAAAVIFYTLSTVTGSALQGIDRMNSPVKHSCISLIVHIILLWLLLKYTHLGIYAMVIGSATFPILIFVLNLWELYCCIGYRQEIFATFVLPLLAAVIMGIFTFLIYQGLFLLTKNNAVSILMALLAAVAIYFAILAVYRKKRLY